jgi:hypothetical protein
MNPQLEYHDKLVIGEDLFRIDPGRQRLQDLGDSKNSIAYSEMVRHEEHAYFIYNKKEKHLAPTSFVGSNTGGDLVSVRIPTRILELQHERSLRQNDQVNLTSFLLDQGFQLLGLKYAERMLGISPQILVGKVICHYDPLHKSVGRSPGKPDVYLDRLNKISDNDGEFYECLYNRTDNHLVETKPLPEDRAEGHYWTRIPEVKKIDPIGYAVSEGRPPYTYINECQLYTRHLQVSLDRSGIITTLPGLKYTDDMYQIKQQAYHKMGVSEQLSPIFLYQMRVERIRKLLEDKQKFMAGIQSLRTDATKEQRQKRIEQQWYPSDQTQKEDRRNRGNKVGR